nr:6,7-dimethyl-8-ribityllumazine synthase [Ipomoea batatas]
MGNSLRCCLACVLPCGALDLIRIVHLNGHVEEITHPITADEVLKNNPNHVLSQPSSQGMVRRILILSPTSELKRGSIYFLIPASSVPADKKKNAGAAVKPAKKSGEKSIHANGAATAGCDRYSTEKKSSPASHRRRRSGKVGEWRPHLASISED